MYKSIDETWDALYKYRGPIEEKKNKNSQQALSYIMFLVDFKDESVIDQRLKLAATENHTIALHSNSASALGSTL